jgi:hypothetical protein
MNQDNILISLYSVFGRTANFRNPGGVMRLRRYATDMSYMDAISKLGEHGYVTRIECDIDGIRDGKNRAKLMALNNMVQPGHHWTAFITSSQMGTGRILRLVFAFLSEADAMYIKLKLPDYVQPNFRLTRDVPVLS